MINYAENIKLSSYILCITFLFVFSTPNYSESPTLTSAKTRQAEHVGNSDESDFLSEAEILRKADEAVFLNKNESSSKTDESVLLNKDEHSGKPDESGTLSEDEIFRRAFGVDPPESKIMKLSVRLFIDRYPEGAITIYADSKNENIFLISASELKEALKPRLTQKGMELLSEHYSRIKNNKFSREDLYQLGIATTFSRSKLSINIKLPGALKSKVTIDLCNAPS